MDGSVERPYGPPMIHRPSRSGWVAAIAAALMAAMPVPASAACLSPREARDAVASGEAMRLSRVARVVEGEVLDAQLCEDNGGLVYRLTVMTPGGRIATVVVDARTGTVMGR